MYLFYVQTEHGKVVVRIGSMTMAFNLALHCFYHILGTHVAGALDNFKQLLFTKLNLFVVLSLIQSVGIYKQLSATDILNHLACKLQSFPKSYRRIGFHRYELALAAIGQNRWVVAGIAEVELTCWQMDHADEHSDKHAVVVVLNQLRIEFCSDLFWRVVACSCAWP